MLILCFVIVDCYMDFDCVHVIKLIRQGQQETYFELAIWRVAEALGVVLLEQETIQHKSSRKLIYESQPKK